MAEPTVNGNLGAVNVDHWGTGDRNDCYWNIAKNQLGEGATAQEINALCERLQAYNKEKNQTLANKNMALNDGDQVFIPIEYAMDEIQANIGTLTEEMTQIQSEITTAQTALGEANTNVGTALTEFNSALSAYNSAPKTVEKDGEQVENPELKNLKSAMDTAQKNYTEALQKQREAQETLQAQQEALQERKEALDGFKQELADYKEEYDELEQEQRDKIEGLEQAVADIETLITDTENAINTAQAQAAVAEQQQAAADSIGVKYDETTGTYTVAGDDSSTDEIEGINSDALSEAVSNNDELVNIAGLADKKIESSEISDDGKTKTITYDDGTVVTFEIDPDTGEMISDGSINVSGNEPVTGAEAAAGKFFGTDKVDEFTDNGDGTYTVVVDGKTYTGTMNGDTGEISFEDEEGRVRTMTSEDFKFDKDEEVKKEALDSAQTIMESALGGFYSDFGEVEYDETTGEYKVTCKDSSGKEVTYTMVAGDDGGVVLVGSDGSTITSTNDEFPSYGSGKERSAEEPESSTSEEELRSQIAEARAQTLFAAMDGAGTNEAAVRDILRNVSGQDLVDVMEAYEAKYGESLEDAIRGDFSWASGESELLGYLNMAKNYAKSAEREEVDESALLDAKVTAFNAATIDMWGTNEQVLNEMILGMSNKELAEFAQYYENKTGKSLESVIKSETSFQQQNILLRKLGNSADAANDTQPEVAPEEETQEQAETRQRGEIATARAFRLYSAMQGAGTDEDAVRDILRNVSGQDLVDVMEAYEARYGESLEDAIRGDFSWVSGESELVGYLNMAKNYAKSADREEISEEAVAEAQAQAFLEATTERWGTDEDAVYDMLINGSLSDDSIIRLAQTLEAKGKNITSIIKSEFSGSVEDALLAKLASLNIT